MEEGAQDKALVRARLVKAGGFFCVGHKRDADRLVYDRRPRNHAEHRLRWARLPAGPLLRHILLPKGHSVRGSLDDLKVFFYSLAQAPGAEKYNPVGRCVTGQQLRDAGYPGYRPDARFCSS